MNKFKIFALIVGLAAMAFFVKGVKADEGGLIAGGRAHFYTNVIGSSQTVFAAPCVLYSITNSSGNGIDYSVIYDTVPGVGLIGGASSALHQVRASPAVIFSSVTWTSGNTNTGNGLFTQWGQAEQEGLRMQRGIFCFKSSSSSGEAFITTVEWGVQ